MSGIPDDDLEHLARGGGGNDLFPQIVRLLGMDDDTCTDQPKTPMLDRPSLH
jgi:hypothetical protein